jgi:hypothetical protein
LRICWSVKFSLKFCLISQHSFEIIKVATTGWLYTERLVEVLSQLKTEHINFLKSVINDKKEWGGKTHIFTQGYFDILRHFDFNFYLRKFL